MSRLQNIGGEMDENQLSQRQAGSCSLFLYNQTVAGRVSKITTADRSRSLKKILKEGISLCVRMILSTQVTPVSFRK
jgi:hypothetical protein